MKKKILSFVMSLAVMASSFPCGTQVKADAGKDLAKNASYEEGYGAKDASDKKKEAFSDSENERKTASDAVIVLYEDNAIDMDGGSSGANISDSFGNIIKKSIRNGKTKKSAKKGIENTLKSQGKILEKSLGDDYAIEDTVIFDPKGERAVVSIVSSEKYSAEDISEKLSSQSGIKAAEPDYEIRALSTSASDLNDSYNDYSWYLNGEGSINLDKAWAAYESTKKDDEKETVVAVIDTGVDYTHEELKDHMWINATDSSSLRGTYGYDFAYQDEDPMDENGHGTHCAGIIAAAMNNNAGIAGICAIDPNIKIMALRMLDEDGSGSLSMAIGAYYYVDRAISEGVNVRVINDSWGGAFYSALLDDVIDIVGKKGAISICAAGNEASDNDKTLIYPATSASSYVVSVGSTSEDGKLATYSNYGSNSVDIAAPGTNIISSVSYYNYMPWIYNEDLRKQTSLCFANVTKDTKVDDDGSVTLGDLGKTSFLSSEADADEKMSLSVSDDNDFDGTGYSLAWTIDNPKPGEDYYLYFPQMPRPEGAGYDNAYMNVLVNGKGADSQTSQRSGVWYAAEWAFTQKDDGSVQIMDLGYPNASGVGGDYSDIWKGGGFTGFMDESDMTGADITGFAIDYEAASSDTVTIYIDSIGITDKIEYRDSNSNGYYDDTEIYGKYDLYSGTSMASPVVSGEVSLLCAMYPDKDESSIQSMILGMSDGSITDGISSGGMTDFATVDFDNENAFAPAISRAVVDIDKDTVTLEGADFGSSLGNIDYEKPYKGDKGSIGNMEWSNEKVIITNASQYSLIGSGVRFFVTSSAGKKSTNYFYLVNGETKFEKYVSTNQEYEDDDDEDDEDEWKKTGDQEDVGASSDEGKTDSSTDDPQKKKDDAASQVTGDGAGDGRDITVYDDVIFYFEDDSYTETNSYSMVSGGDRLYEVDSYGEIYVTTKDSPRMLVGYLNDAILSSQNHKSWDLNKYQESALEIKNMYGAAYSGGKIYEWVEVLAGDVYYYVLTALDLSTEEYEILYDSAGKRMSEIPVNTADVLGGCMVALDGSLYWMAGASDTKRQVYDDFFKGEISKASSWTKATCAKSSLPEGLYEGCAVAKDGRIYYAGGGNTYGTTSINDSIYCYDVSADTWGVLSKKLPEYIPTASTTGVLPTIAMGIYGKGLVISGLTFDGYGDSLIYDLNNDSISGLGATIFGSEMAYTVTGTTIGDYLYVAYTGYYEDYVEFTEFLRTKVPSSAYSVVKVTKKGMGNANVTGACTYVKGDTAQIGISIADNNKNKYYINKVQVDGKTVKRADAKKKLKNYTCSFTASKDTHNVTVSVGKYVKKVKVTYKKAKVKAGKSVKFKAVTNGTSQKLIWSVNKKSYASINKNTGKFKAKKKGRGKTVKVTVCSAENRKIKKTFKVKIK